MREPDSSTSSSRLGPVNTKQVDLFILPLTMTDVGSTLSEEVPDVSIPVEKTSSRIGTEATLVRIQSDRVGILQTLELSSEVRAETGVQVDHALLLGEEGGVSPQVDTSRTSSLGRD